MCSRARSGCRWPPTFVTFAGSPHASTFYPIALAEAISNSNKNGTSEEIDARFNSSIDNGSGVGCFANIKWWYATTTANPNPGNHVSLFPGRAARTRARARLPLDRL